MSAGEILVSAGEPSGEMYAARLVAALQRRSATRAFGMGGVEMRQAGVELLADAAEVAVVGISEALHRLPTAWRILGKLTAAAAERNPDMAIVVDFPDFNLRLARRLHRLGIRVVYFISPQVWAWRVWRVRAIRKLVERMIVILPFEEKFYRHAGVPVSYVGHPLVDWARPNCSRSEFAAANGLDAGRHILALLPGSRPGEVAHNLPPMLEACRKLAADPRCQFVLAAAPAMDAASFAAYLPAGLDVRVLEGQTYNALAAADCAIVSSGTATVEAALLGAPMVVVYRVSRVTALVARRLIRAPFFSMVNLILEEAVVPELIQEEFTPQRVAQEVGRLLGSAEARSEMRRELAVVRRRLSVAGPDTAIDRAANIVQQLLNEPRGATSSLNSAILL